VGAALRAPTDWTLVVQLTSSVTTASTSYHNESKNYENEPIPNLSNNSCTDTNPSDPRKLYRSNDAILPTLGTNSLPRSITHCIRIRQ